MQKNNKTLDNLGNGNLISLRVGKNRGEEGRKKKNQQDIKPREDRFKQINIRRVVCNIDKGNEDAQDNGCRHQYAYILKKFGKKSVINIYISHQSELIHVARCTNYTAIVFLLSIEHHVYKFQ